MSEIHRYIKNCGLSGRIRLATITKGASCGGQILLSDSEVIYNPTPNDFSMNCIQKLQGKTESGMFEIDNKQIFCEILGEKKELVICGAGHISIPIIMIGKMIGFTITVLEDRPSFANRARAAKADMVICEAFSEGLRKISGNADTFFVIVTRGHRYDQICLSYILKKAHAYIGMIGSKVRVKKVKELLEEQGGDVDILNSIHSPIGLDIGAETPEEIAVAIMAEIIQVKNQNLRSCGYTQDLLEHIIENERKNMPSTLATIISRKGPAPREVGTKMLINRDGTTAGTIGGGCVEAELFQIALRMAGVEHAESKVCQIDMTGKNAEDEGMVCGGTIEVLLERVS